MSDLACTNSHVSSIQHLSASKHPDIRTRINRRALLGLHSRSASKRALNLVASSRKTSLSMAQLFNSFKPLRYMRATWNDNIIEKRGSGQSKATSRSSGSTSAKHHSTYDPFDCHRVTVVPVVCVSTQAASALLHVLPAQRHYSKLVVGLVAW